MAYDFDEHAGPTFSDLLWSRVAYSQFQARDELLRWGLRRKTADRLVSSRIITAGMAALTLLAAALVALWIVVALAGRATARVLGFK